MREGQKKALARTLRREGTAAERIVWYLLRDRRFADAKFRRQVPIGPYIADFASIEHRLVIELDGGQHAENIRDVKRDAFLAAIGWRVLRFWNNDVMKNREGVLEKIFDTVAPRAKGARHPLPQAGEGISCAFLNPDLAFGRLRAAIRRGARTIRRFHPAQSFA